MTAESAAVEDMRKKIKEYDEQQAVDKALLPYMREGRLRRITLQRRGTLYAYQRPYRRKPADRKSSQQKRRQKLTTKCMCSYTENTPVI